MPGQRVMVEWPSHGRHHWTGEVVGYEETPMGPLVKVEFDNGEKGLYEHEYLRLPVSKARGHGGEGRDG